MALASDSACMLTTQLVSYSGLTRVCTSHLCNVPVHTILVLHAAAPRRGASAAGNICMQAEGAADRLNGALRRTY